MDSLQHDGAVRNSKLLWVLGNYSRFVRPGMVRIECSLDEEQPIEDGLLVSAYKDAGKGHTVYVFTNLSEQERRVYIGTHRKVKTYTTDKQRNLERTFQYLDNVSIPKRAVVTVVD